jgi:thioredoxin-related protein
MSLKPIVDGLEREWKAGQVIRVDVLTPLGRSFADQHGFQATPTFILFDGHGNEVRRWVGRPPSLNELPK